MEYNSILAYLNSGQMGTMIFKITAVFLSVFYLLYSLVLSKQVRIMDKSLSDRFNQFIFIICSLQITIALILLIFSLFLL